jgi:hypothetical protein
LLQPIHEAELLSYLELSGCEVGLLINFNVKLIASGIPRLVNQLAEQPSAYSAVNHSRLEQVGNLISILVLNRTAWNSAAQRSM